jgi:hypothetical protein
MGFGVCSAYEISVDKPRQIALKTTANARALAEAFEAEPTGDEAA